MNKFRTYWETLPSGLKVMKVKRPLWERDEDFILQWIADRSGVPFPYLIQLKAMGLLDKVQILNRMVSVTNRLLYEYCYNKQYYKRKKRLKK